MDLEDMREKNHRLTSDLKHDNKSSHTKLHSKNIHKNIDSSYPTKKRHTPNSSHDRSASLIIILIIASIALILLIPIILGVLLFLFTNPIGWLILIILIVLGCKKIS